MKRFLQNERGVGIILVMSAITILTLLIASFSYVVSVNKIRIFNNQDSQQARLNAEAGINMALAQLEIYQQAFNLYQKNETVKKSVSFVQVEKILTQPFSFPIPLDKEKMNLVQKTALEDFEKSVVLKGGFTLTIQPVTGFLNPNLLAIPVEKESTDEFRGFEEVDNDQPNSNRPLHLQFEDEFNKMLEEVFTRKIEESDDFADKYSNLKLSLLTKDIKYFTSTIGQFNGPEQADLELGYEDSSPKFAPLASIEEMYSLGNWPSEIVELVKDRFSVYVTKFIPMNKITPNQLKVLFPQMTKEQIQEFFLNRDGNPAENIPPTPLKSEGDFKRLLTSTIGVPSDEVNSRLEELKKLGLSLGVTGKVFKVISQGVYQNATVTLTAFVDMPLLPEPEKKEDDKDENFDPDDPFSENKPKDSDKNPEEKEKPPPPPQLMKPRVVELIKN